MTSSCDSADPIHILRSIDDKIEEHYKAIILPKRQRNSNVPVFRLPAETLSTIFLYIVLDEHDDDTFVSGWISITYVCHFWREVAVNSPSLWTCWGSIPNPRWIETFFSRSDQAPLYIRTVEWLAGLDIKSFVELLQRSNCRDRVRELYIIGYPPEDFREILDVFGHCQASDDSANRVSECSIRSVDLFSDRIFSLPRAFQSLRFPHLCRIRLDACEVDWNSTFLESSVLTHVSFTSQHGSVPTMSRLLSILSKQPLLEEFTFDEFRVIHADDTDLSPINLPRLRFIKLEGFASSCFTLMTKLYYPRTQIRIILSVSSHDDSREDFPLYAVPFFSKHYGDHGNHDSPPIIGHLAITHHIVLHVVCAPYLLQPSDPHSVHEPCLRLNVFDYDPTTPAIMTAAFAHLPVHSVRSFLFERNTLDYTFWWFTMLDTMDDLEEMSLHGAGVEEVVMALNSGSDKSNAICDEDADHQPGINRGEVKDAPILLPKLRALRIVGADRGHKSLTHLAPWLESRKLANRELQVLSLGKYMRVYSDQVENYRKLVKEVILDT